MYLFLFLVTWAFEAHDNLLKICYASAPVGPVGPVGPVTPVTPVTPVAPVAPVAPLIAALKTRALKSDASAAAFSIAIPTTVLLAV
jgi:hypothetical protein